MITVKQYNAVLRSVTENNLETIRVWRNKESSIEHMFFQESISPEQQVEWYRQLDKKHNLYFIYNEQGVIHLKNVDWEKKEAEAGIFTIHIEKYMINMAAVITLMDFAFDVLLLETLMAKVKSTSVQNVAMNLNLGYRIFSEVGNCTTLQCKKTDYNMDVQIRKWLKKRANNNAELMVELTKEAYWLKNYMKPL